MNISFLKEKGSKYIVFILAGLLILVMCIPTGSKTSQLVKEESNTESELENQLETVLSAMEGVGEVEVMITTQSNQASLFGNENDSPNVCGVVVVAEGAGVPSVNARISEAVKALFSIDAHKISIVKMRSQEGDR